ncbi:MAG: transcriptional regulator [Methylomonas sp.]|nr:MAG: transcriptional regulator [Methylomonas sp.]
MVANAAAESYVDDTLDWIQSGQAFEGHTGQLEQSINWRPESGGVAEVFANAAYAGYVEFGTRPHVIEPKPGRKGLKIPVSTGGGFIIRRRVNHPGSKAHPFFFADQDNREQHAQERGLLVLALRAVT